MSTVIMSACWPLQGMTATQKAVLISLADNANDEGVCWPSVSNIALRTCLSERAVQGAIKALQQLGALYTEDRTGRSTIYKVTPEAYSPPQEVHPRTKCTPADASPANDVHPTPANGAPHPRSSCTQNRNRTIKEPSSSLPAVPAATSRRRSGKSRADDAKAEQQRQEACRAIWSAYSEAYETRYHAKPIRNAKVNTQVNDLLKRLGAEAAPVAAYFVSIEDAYLKRTYHEFGQLLAKAEGYRTAWATAGNESGADWTAQAVVL
ncbi:helix-turn-helix domain-containing protein [Metapseudomonas lalkuanensis]|uniref:helix-turn-helix domain-containing protein n=1 Tax=Metapseudomonas lalkuanensis TaxID=2604832 RepID=UPI001CF56DAD|nr:helix-turn-helix domain-containing protein [Pseudomonas lalkuanensis]UCP00081.1 helix-turn-helix domain-containing protein [Pseudomonas lalkuanensis]